MLSAKQKTISLILKAAVVISAVLGTFLSAYAGRDSFMGGKVVFMYFTIQSNIAIAYAVYAGIAYANNWQFAEGVNYPYFFLNWGSPAGAFGFTKEMPYMGCVWWGVLLLVFLIIVGYLYLKIADGLKRKKNP